VREEVRNLEYPEYASDISKSNLLGNYVFSQDKELIDKISNYIGTKPDQIIITAGCDGALRIIAETFISKNDNVLMPCPTFGRYEFHTKMMGGNCIFLYFDEPFEFNLDKVKETIKERNIKILFLCNPNNPTGHYISQDDIEDFVKNVNCLIVIDEALADYLGETASKLIDRFPNIIVTRTFSKFFMLASLRIGYIIVSEKLKPFLMKVISPFEVSSYSIERAKEVLSENIKPTKTVPIKLVKGSVDGVDGNNFRGLEGRDYKRVFMGIL